MILEVKLLYEYFFSKVSGYADYHFSPTKRQLSMINNFIDKKKTIINSKWLFDFFLFQFHRYYDKETQFGRGIVQLNWVIGDKALQKWDSRTEEELYYVDKFRKEYQLQNPLEEEVELVLSKSYFNDIRKMSQLFRCVELELYNKRNIICKICSNNLICRELCIKNVQFVKG